MRYLRFKVDSAREFPADALWGEVLVAQQQGALAGIWFAAQKYAPEVNAAWQRDPSDSLLLDTKSQLLQYFDGKRRRFDVPMALPGTAFQRSVWNALMDIPFGHTESYGQLAAHLGKPTAVRAVAAAVGRNPASVVVPCHRVLGKNGALTGYAGGLARKAALLELEGYARNASRSSDSTPQG